MKVTGRTAASVGALIGGAVIWVLEEYSGSWLALTQRRPAGRRRHQCGQGVVPHAGLGGVVTVLMDFHNGEGGGVLADAAKPGLAGQPVRDWLPARLQQRDGSARASQGRYHHGT